MADTLEISRDTRNIQFFINVTLLNLVACYGELRKDVTFDTFISEVMDPIIVGDDPLLENVSDILMNMASDEDPRQWKVDQLDRVNSASKSTH